MKHTALILLLSCLSIFAKGQTKAAAPAKDYSKTIKMQVDSMGQLLLSKDYREFARYTYPKIINAMGGRDSMVNILGRMMDGMAAQGMEITKINFGAPSKPVSVGKQLQCTIPQTMEMKILSGHIVAKSTLVGVSDDGGRHWNFIDMSNADNPATKLLLPELSSKLVIPAKQQPKYTADK